ncbi:hypothetical protein MGH68_14565 [Erysipelothrix sp. D19-032]
MRIFEAVDKNGISMYKVTMNNPNMFVYLDQNNNLALDSNYMYQTSDSSINYFPNFSFEISDEDLELLQAPVLIEYILPDGSLIEADSIIN